MPTYVLLEPSSVTSRLAQESRFRLAVCSALGPPFSDLYPAPLRSIVCIMIMYQERNREPYVVMTYVVLSVILSELTHLQISKLLSIRSAHMEGTHTHTIWGLGAYMPLRRPGVDVNRVCGFCTASYDHDGDVYSSSSA